jgi:hypothetical protein
MQVLLALRPRSKVKILAEILLIGLALPLYYLVRGSAHERVGEALVRGTQVVEFEKSLGIFWEVDLQHLILHYDWLVQFLNGFYLYGHLPVIGALAVWMYFRHHREYLIMRNTFLISGAIGLIVYLTFPVAPPRFLPQWGFVDTVMDQYNTGRPLTPGFFVNEYAAMPSLHFGWNLLVGVAVWLASRNIVLRSFAVIMPPMMLADIVLTGNHYFVDAGAGVLVIGLGAAIALGVRSLVRRLWPESPKTPGERVWRGWLYWLCGLSDPAEWPQAGASQGAPA